LSSSLKKNKCYLSYITRKPQTPADSVKLESSIKTKGKAGAKASKGAAEKEAKDAKRQVYYKKNRLQF